MSISVLSEYSGESCFTLCLLILKAVPLGVRCLRHPASVWKRKFLLIYYVSSQVAVNVEINNLYVLHRLIHQTFIYHLLCIRQFLKHWGYISDTKRDMVSTNMGERNNKNCKLRKIDTYNFCSDNVFKKNIAYYRQ